MLAQDGRFNNANNYDWFSGLYGSTRRIASWQDTDLFILARNVGRVHWRRGGADRAISIPSARAGNRCPASWADWDYSVEAAGQFGSIQQSGKRLEHRAYAVNIDRGTHVEKDRTAHPVWAWATILVLVTATRADDRNETFELLFGTNHRFLRQHGFDGPSQHAHSEDRRLIQARQGKSRCRRSGSDSGWPIRQTFCTRRAVPDATRTAMDAIPAISSHVGQEFDLLVDWRPTAWGQVRAGYGRFFTSAITSVDPSIPSRQMAGR